MFLGNECARGGVINWDETYQKSARYMAMVGLHENPRTLIKDIGVGKQQLVEIAKALAKNVKLLILDEPTSSLNESDAKSFWTCSSPLKRRASPASSSPTSSTRSATAPTRSPSSATAIP